MAFLGDFIFTAVKAILIFGAAFGGIMIGKNMRKKKDAKDAQE